MTAVNEQNTGSSSFEPTKRNWRSFNSLLLMQSQNAFNDKAVQFLLICTCQALVQIGTDNFLTNSMQYLLGVLIVTPFIFFAPLAGWISDRFPKSKIIRFSSLFQVGVFILLTVAIHLRSLELLVVGFFLLAIQSAILSPSKLGVIKELVGKKNLGYASGVLEMLTILGILGGSIIMSHWYGLRLGNADGPWAALEFPMYVLLAFTPISVLGAFMVEKTQAKSKEKFCWSLTYKHFQQVGGLLKRRELRLSSLAVTYFWVFGGYIQLLSVQIAKESSESGGVGLGPDLANLMLVAGVGIALGSIVASLVSKRQIELGLVPVGGFLMAVSCLLMAICTPLSFAFMTWMFVSGIGAALFLVPVNACLQDSCNEDERGDILAANNLLNCLGGILAVGVQALMFMAWEVSVEIQLVVLGLVTVAATIYSAKLLPQQVVRFVMLMLVRVVYRIRIVKDSNMPKEGGVLLTPNHVSYLDAFIISAASPRPIRFLIFDEYYNRRWMIWFLKLFNTVPISRNRAKEAILVAADAVAAGDVVCIFPEGQLSRTGTLNEIKRGFEMIARKANCPVLPVYMDGLWGSIFSFERGKFINKKPYTVQYGVTVVFGELLQPKQAKNTILRESLLVLGAEAMCLRNAVVKVDKLSRKHAKVLEGNNSYVEKVFAQFVASSKEVRKSYALNALQIVDGPAVKRGATIGVDVRVIDDLGPLLLHALPVLNRNKLVVIDSSCDVSELCRMKDQFSVVAWFGGKALWEILDESDIDGDRYDLEKRSDGDEHGWWHKGGRVLAINMVDPNATTKTQQFQSGSKDGTLGRILAGYCIGDSIRDGLGNKVIDLGAFDVDEVGFVSAKSEA